MTKHLELRLVNSQVEAHFNLLGIIIIHMYEVQRLKPLFIFALTFTFGFPHCFLSRLFILTRGRDKGRIISKLIVLQLGTDNVRHKRLRC